MVEGSSSGNGNKPQLRVIHGELAEKTPKMPDSHKKFPHLAAVVEPIVQGMLWEARQLADAREKINLMCITALARAEVGGDAIPILREATVVADSQEDRLLAAELMVDVADVFQRSGLDPWPIMDMAFKCATEAPPGREKEDVLAGIAYSYAVLGDYPRAERIMDMLTEFELRKGLNAAIEELISSPES